MKQLTYRHTILTCCMAYVVQSLVINFVPLLFVQFQMEFSVNLIELTGLVTLNFLVQLVTDALSIPIIHLLGYRMVGIIAHLCSIFGLLAMVFLTGIMSPYIGLVIATVLYSTGGGLIEVVTNPIVESIPTQNSSRMMSILHSFYSWGFVVITILATLYFYFIGVSHWRWLTIIWTLVPIINLWFFIFVPIPEVIDEVEDAVSISKVISSKIFWIFAIMMFCAGASEMALSQWLSLFMEEAVGFSKTVGDLAGPLSFAIMMGVARSFYGLANHSLSVLRFIIYCLIVLTVSILLIGMVEMPAITLMASAIYGGAVGILWPGTYSLAAKNMASSGPIMFGLLALVGDLGCAMGPSVIGYVATVFDGNLRIGILSSLIFPVIFILTIIYARKIKYL